MGAVNSATQRPAVQRLVGAAALAGVEGTFLRFEQSVPLRTREAGHQERRGSALSACVRAKPLGEWGCGQGGTHVALLLAEVNQTRRIVASKQQVSNLRRGERHEQYEQTSS